MDTRESQGTGESAQQPQTSQESGPSKRLNLTAYRRARRRQAAEEAYWAGRNRAARRSTRAAA